MLKPAKSKLGRPMMPGRRVVVKLEEKHITRAGKIGGGNVARGIRRALDDSPDNMKG